MSRSVTSIGIVYQIVNSANGIAYIGLTTRKLSRRWNDHLSAVRKGEATPLYRAIRKYGVDNFTIEAIACCLDHEALKETERTLIAERRTHVSVGGYNVTIGGDGTWGRTHSPEAIEKMRAASRKHMECPARRAALSVSAKKQLADPEMRERMYAGRRGKRLSPERCAQISAAGKGRIVSEETRRLLSEQRKGVKRPPSVGIKISAARRGSHHSDASRAKMSASRKGKPKSESWRLALSAALARRRKHLKGASPAKGGKWQAHIYHNGKSKYLGRFPTELAAHLAQVAAGNGGHPCA